MSTGEAIVAAIIVAGDFAFIGWLIWRWRLHRKRTGYRVVNDE